MIEDLLYASCRKVWEKSYFHTERTFCYELYHQMRNYLEDEQNINFVNANNLNNIVITAEITKDLGSLTIPDMIFHNDVSCNNDDMSNQFLVMEVKNTIQLDKDIAKDLEKIYNYMNGHLNYKNGIILLFKKTPYARETTFLNRVKRILNFEINNITFKSKFNLLTRNNDKNLYFIMVTGQDNNQINNVTLLKYSPNLFR